MKDADYIERCLQLAKNGNAFTKPNPSVGAVIVLQNRVIGEGYTSPYGGPHAEINAIRSVQHKDDLRQATLYVTLEPCSHFGKTPPCANSIVKYQFKRVVVGCLDVNPEVSGKGVRILKEAKIEVTVGVLEDKCKAHHQSFFVQQKQRRPYIILKWAQTKNGYLAPAVRDERRPFWITNKYAQQLVHKWRSEEQAILVGTTTVAKDNPKLNTRNWFGQNPLRIVLDARLSLPEDSNVFDDSTKTLVLIDAKTKMGSRMPGENTIYEKVNFNHQLAHQVCALLNRYHIQSLIVEGGAKTLQTFIDEQLWDESRVLIGQNEIKEGLKAPNLEGEPVMTQSLNDDQLLIYKND